MLLVVACRNVFQYEELTVLHACCKAVGCVAIHFRGRLNTTRMAGPADLLLSLLRMATGIRRYASDHPDKKACQISIPVWEDIAAFEALANVMAWFTTIVQNERLFICGFRPVLWSKLLKSLSPESEVGIIDWTCPGMGAEPLHNKKLVSELSPNGQKSFSQALDGTMFRCGTAPGSALTKNDKVAFLVDLCLMWHKAEFFDDLFLV